VQLIAQIAARLRTYLRFFSQRIPHLVGLHLRHEQLLEARQY